MGPDDTQRWIGAVVFLAIPGVYHLVRVRLRGSAITRIRDFEQRHGCRVPDQVAAELGRRLAMPELILGIVLVALAPLVGAVQLTLLGIPLSPVDDVVAALGVVFVARAVGSSWQAARPLSDSAGAVARPRAVVLPDYVSPGLRRTARALQGAAAVVLVVAVGALVGDLVAGREGLLVVFVAVAAAVVLGQGVIAEVSARRLIAAPEPAADEAHLFVQDALRSDELGQAYESVVVTGLLGAILWVLWAALLLGLEAGLPQYLVGAAVSGALYWWVTRPDPPYLDRLWGGQVPEALRPVASESAQAGQPTENGVTT